MEKLTALYEGIADSLGLVTDDQGRLSSMIAGSKHPLMIDKKRLVIPHRELLQNPDWDSMVAFHPLSESVTRGESPVLKKIRALVNLRLTTVISDLMIQLMEIAADTDSHSKLSVSQTKFLKLVPDADATTVTKLVKIIQTIDPTKGNRRIVNVYLKRGGELDGQKYSRLARVSFPFAEELEEAKGELFGVKLRKKDIASISALFDYIVPDATDITEYSSGNRSMTAPYFDALMRAFIKVAEQTNSIVKKFKKRLDDAEGLMINLDWVEQINDFPKLAKLIPTLDGNDGELSLADEEEEDPKSSGPALNTLSQSGSSAAVEERPAAVTEQPAESSGPYGHLPKLGQPSATLDKKVSNERKPLQAQPQEERWDEYVERRNAPIYPQFPVRGGAPMQQPMGRGYSGGFQQPMNTGFGGMGMAPQPVQPAPAFPTFRAKGESPASGQPGGGMPPRGSITSV